MDGIVGRLRASMSHRALTRAERDAAADEIERLRAYEAAVIAHNKDCQERCGLGESEAVACRYRPYFVASGRRCSNCPTYEMIDVRAPDPTTEPHS